MCAAASGATGLSQIRQRIPEYAGIMVAAADRMSGTDGQRWRAARSPRHDAPTSNVVAQTLFATDLSDEPTKFSRRITAS